MTSVALNNFSIFTSKRFNRKAHKLKNPRLKTSVSMVKDLSKSSVVSKGFMQGTNVALRGRALLVVQYVGGKVAD